MILLTFTPVMKILIVTKQADANCVWSMLKLEDFVKLSVSLKLLLKLSKIMASDQNSMVGIPNVSVLDFILSIETF